MKRHRSPQKRRFNRKTTPKVKSGKVQRKNYRDISVIQPKSFKITYKVPPLGYVNVLTEEDIHKFTKLLPDWKELVKDLDEIALGDLHFDEYWGVYDSNVLGFYNGEDRKIEIYAWPEGYYESFNAFYFQDHAEIFNRLEVPVSKKLGKLLTSMGLEHIKDLDAGHISEEVLQEIQDDEDDDTEYADDEFGIETVQKGREWYIKTRAGTIAYHIVKVTNCIDIYPVRYLCKFTKEKVRAFQLLYIFLHELGHHYDSIHLPNKGWIIRGEDYAERYAIKYQQIIWERYRETFKM